MEYFKVLYGQKGEELGVQSEAEYQANLQTGNWFNHPDSAKAALLNPTIKAKIDSKFVEDTLGAGISNKQHKNILTNDRNKGKAHRAITV